MEPTKEKITVNPNNGKLVCPRCGKQVDWLTPHLRKAHRITREQAAELFTGPIISEGAKRTMGNRTQCQVGKKKGTIVVGVSGDTTEETAPNTTEEKPEENQEAPATEAADDDTLTFGKISLKIRPMEQDRYIPSHDENYQPNLLLLEYLAMGVKLNQPVLLVGPTGCGKSSAVMELAAILNQPLRRVSLNGDFATADFLGEKTIQVDPATGQSIVNWQDGILPQAMRSGSWLLVDEIDSAHPSVLFALQTVLEGNPLTLAGNGGEVVEPHPDFRFFATANTIGTGDDTGLYTGTKILNEATLDRFGVVHRVDYLPEAEEVRVILDKSGLGKKPELVKALVRVAREVRQGFEIKACFCTFSTRRLINLGKAINQLGSVRRGFEVAVLARLRPEDAEYVKGMAQRVMGSNFSS